MREPSSKSPATSSENPRPAAQQSALTPLSIELSKDDRAQAIASIERYFREHRDEKIGNIAGGGLLGILLEEIGPGIYNKAVADVQERMQARVADLDFEVHEAEFAYWRKYDKAGKGKS